jgi:Uri superfamily endonuclease
VHQPEIPAAPGCYLLLLYLSRRSTIIVGELGEHRFASGYYAYIGSAFGPGGLRARLGRHLNRNKATRWHIDYLRAASKPVTTLWEIEARIEHTWAEQLLGDPAASMPMPRFGSSDCRCQTHLTYWGRRCPSSAQLAYVTAPTGH